MKDYQNLLDEFVNRKARKDAKKYLEKYWLNNEEYGGFWQEKQNIIFSNKAKYLPDMIFNEKYELICFIGGAIFSPENFDRLMECAKKTGDKYFVIIENAHTRPLSYNERKDLWHETALFRFKFPTDITWNELQSGGSLSVEIFDISNREYFIFGATGNWGKYAATGYTNKSLNLLGTPLDIIGYKKEYRGIFAETFEITDEEKETIRKWLPNTYRDKCLENL